MKVTKTPEGGLSVSNITDEETTFSIEAITDLILMGDPTDSFFTKNAIRFTFDNATVEYQITGHDLQTVKAVLSFYKKKN